MFLYILFSILNILFALAILYLTLAFITGAPYVPSTNRAAQSMIDLAQIKPGMKIYDLGSGDGKLLLLAAGKKASATGFEINPFLVILSKIRSLFSPDKKLIYISWKNFWTAKLSDADIVFIYLLPWRMEKLADILAKQLKPGAIIVSNSFIFPNWPIVRQDRNNHVFVFQIGKNS
jgi:hypothetical protein